MRSCTLRILGCAVVLAAALGASPAKAQTEPFYVTLDMGASGPLNDPATDLFSFGGNGALGLYYSFIPEIALGARVGAGGLADGGTIPQLEPEDDPGVLDFGTVGLALRIRPLGHVFDLDRRGSGLYLEIGPVAALLDGEVVPAYEAAAGWNFGIGPMTIGPNFRFNHFIETEGRFADNSIMTWTAGLGMTFADEVHMPPPAPVVVELPRPEPIAVDNDRDNDGYLNANDGCPDRPETWNGYEDTDGCPDEGRGQFVNDALVVDERVFFDYGSDELRPTGAEQLDVVVRHWEENRERYDHLAVSGHTDVRGDEEANVVLSERRAQVVMNYLKEHGVPAEVIRIEARGETDPEIANATTEYEHQVNRRVEFRVEWQVGMIPEGIAPEPNPTMPDYVDPAPPAVQEREARIARREQRRQEREMARAERREREAQPSEPTAAVQEREVTPAEPDVR